MDSHLLIDKIITIENILINNQGKNDNIIKFGLNEIKTMLSNIHNLKDNSNSSEIKRLNKIIEEKDNIINKLRNELNSLKMNNNKNKNNENVKLGCQHFKRVNVFVKCSGCKEFFTCYNCHDIQKSHSFQIADINKCRFCNTIYNNDLDYCPGCNVKKNLID